MSAIRHNDLFARYIATRTMIVINRHQPREFTMGTSVGLKGEMSEAREFAE